MSLLYKHKCNGWGYGTLSELLNQPFRWLYCHGLQLMLASALRGIGLNITFA